MTTPQTAFSGLQKIYDQARPRYPQDALNLIASKLREQAKGKPVKLLDVGCGTGILTRQLQEALPDARITACDVNEDMLAQARAEDVNATVTWHQASAEALPFAPNSFLAITVAQAVQWFDRPRFYAQAMQVLQPGGSHLILIENNRTIEGSPFMQAYESLIETHNTTYSRNYRQHDYAQEMQEAGFSAVQTHQLPWTRTMTKAQFLSMAQSSTKVQSAIAASAGAFLPQLEVLLDQHWPATSSIAIAYTTKIYSAQVA